MAEVKCYRMFEQINVIMIFKNSLLVLIKIHLNISSVQIDFLKKKLFNITYLKFRLFTRYLELLNILHYALNY